MSPALSPSISASQRISQQKTPITDKDGGCLPLVGDDGAYIFQPEVHSTLTARNISIGGRGASRQTEDVSTDEAVLTPRHEARREGITLDVRAPAEVEMKHIRSPLPPVLPMETPPPLEDLLRVKTNDDADTIQNASLPTANNDRSCTDLDQISKNTSNIPTLSRTDTGRSSIVGFAHGLARHIPDLRMFTPSETLARRAEDRKRRSSRSPSPGEDSSSFRPTRKLSFVLPLPVRNNDSASNKRQQRNKDHVPIACGPQKSSLRDRRNVHLDLELPVKMPDLPARSRIPIENMSSITRPRPRSPKTPAIREEPHKRHLAPLMRNSPIIEDDYIGQSIVHGEDARSLGVLSRNDTISSSLSPTIERTHQKGRDRCYISRPLFRRSRSTRSGTSESVLARTPDGNCTPDESSARLDHQARTMTELQEFGQTCKPARSRRWRWAGAWASSNQSSDDTPLQSPLNPGRRMSINPFKRSARINDEVGNEEVKMPSSYSRILWMKREPLASGVEPRPLANMPVPPTFVPPGLNRIPTPPSLDAHGEIKGKLADFFFDHGAGIRGRRPKASPEGHWDSDALLMSYLSSDTGRPDEDSEEGPEGPLTPSLQTYRRASQITPGLIPIPLGYNMERRVLIETANADADNVWFRIQQEDPWDESGFTAMTLREEDERRKFEWLVPEHLPNSPLCPLYPTYRGYSKGRCYWHKRKGSESSGRGRNSMDGPGNDPRKQTLDVKTGNEMIIPTLRHGKGAWRGGRAGESETLPRDVKKRRLESLSSP